MTNFLDEIHSQIDPVKAFPELKPKEKDDHYSVICPRCKERHAKLYKPGKGNNKAIFCYRDGENKYIGFGLWEYVKHRDKLTQEQTFKALAAYASYQLPPTKPDPNIIPDRPYIMPIDKTDFDRWFLQQANIGAFDKEKYQEVIIEENLPVILTHDKNKGIAPSVKHLRTLLQDGPEKPKGFEPEEEQIFKSYFDYKKDMIRPLTKQNHDRLMNECREILGKNIHHVLDFEIKIYKDTANSQNGLEKIGAGIPVISFTWEAKRGCLPYIQTIDRFGYLLVCLYKLSLWDAQYVTMAWIQEWRKEEQRKRKKTILQSSPTLFTSEDGISPMASSLPVQVVNNFFTHKAALKLEPDQDGKLACKFDVKDGSGYIYAWVSDTTQGTPETLAGEAALAIIDTFDIRAACLHMIYAAQAIQSRRPWEETFTIDDKQIERYLGLNNRKDLSKHEKFKLIAEIAEQPARIVLFIRWPETGKVGAFSIEKARLWDIAIIYHGQEDADGNKDVTGLTIKVRPGLWTEHLLNQQGQADNTAFYQYGFIQQKTLETITSNWQKHPGVSRLLTWLPFQLRRGKPEQKLKTPTLMEIAYGKDRLIEAEGNRDRKKKLADTWDGDLRILQELGWIDIHDGTYPESILPYWAGRNDKTDRPTGYWDILMESRLMVTTPIDIQKHMMGLNGSRQEKPKPKTLKEARYDMGMSQAELAKIVGKSQSWIAMVEKGIRTPSKADKQKIKKILSSVTNSITKL